MCDVCRPRCGDVGGCRHSRSYVYCNDGTVRGIHRRLQGVVGACRRVRLQLFLLLRLRLRLGLSVELRVLLPARRSALQLRLLRSLLHRLILIQTVRLCTRLLHSIC